MKRKVIKTTAIVLAVAIIAGMSILAAASPATTSDPLITLSYLNGPYLTTTVQAEVNKVLASLNTRLDTLDTKVTDEIRKVRDTTNVFRLITITGGDKTLSLSDGNEILVESGIVSVTSGSLVKYSGTAAVVTSGNLAVNNMYLVSGAAVLSAADGAKVWVRSAAAIVPTAEPGQSSGNMIIDPEITDGEEDPDTVDTTDETTEPEDITEPDTAADPDDTSHGQ